MEVEGSLTDTYCLYRKTEKLVNRLQVLVDQFRDTPPVLNQLPSWIRGLQENEYFFFIPQPLINQLGHVLLNNKLVALNTGRTDLPEIQQITLTLLQEHYKKYIWHQYGKEKCFIGEADKAKRICRYCGNSKPATTFKKTAHAIPEALNNKLIICQEECDACNEWLGNNIERDLIGYLAFWRALYRIPGKEGAKKYKGKNFEIGPSGKIHVLSDSPLDDPTPIFPMTIDLLAAEKLSPQKIYKAFCKMVISVLPKQYLNRCQSTIDWIMGRQEIKRLPLIWHKQFNLSALQPPELMIYVRTVEDYGLPGIVGEFTYARLKFVFILPSCEREETAFLTPAVFEAFWKTFKHLAYAEDWKYQDLSSTEKKPLGFTFRIEDLNQIL